MYELEELILGESRETLDIEGLEPHQQILKRMIEQTRVRIDVISRSLDRRLFDQGEVVTAMRTVALSSRHARIRMLIMNTGALVRQEHRLVNLVKRLPTYFSIRMPSRDHKNFNASIVVADKTGYVYRPHAEIGRAHV